MVILFFRQSNKNIPYLSDFDGKMRIILLNEPAKRTVDLFNEINPIASSNNLIMKKLLTFLLLGLCAKAMCQPAYFDADGIVYGITSEADRTVEVWPYYYITNSPYSGAISIPQTVDHDGTTYTVTALGDGAFESCSNVTSLTLPATIRSIGSNCFYNCSFTSLALPDSLRFIGDHAFSYSHIASLHLPACFESFDDCAFWARNLTSITVDEANPHYRSIDGWLYSKDSLTLCIVPDGTTGSVAVPQFVRHIGKMAFGFGRNITAISLPEGLLSIGDFAFNCCETLDGIVIPSSVTRIGICPFSYCPQMNNLSIADGNSHYVMDGLMVYSIGYDTLVSCHKSGATVTLNPNLKVLGGFENNTWVENITIPEGVTDITDNCFNGCSFRSIVLPANMKSIGANAFALNDNLTNVTMPQTLLSMGEGAFMTCMSLKSITIPDSLRIIPKEAFSNCIKLNSITWGNDVEEIGEYAFWAMSYYTNPHITTLDLPSKLKKVGEAAFGAETNYLRYVNFTGPVDTLGEAVFYHANLNHIRFANVAPGVPPAVKGQGPLYEVRNIQTIYIPCGTMELWVSDSYWGQFADKFVEDCEAVVEAENDDIRVYARDGRIVVDGADGEPVSVFDITGRAISTTLRPLPSGVYLVKVGERPAKKVVVL